MRDWAQAKYAANPMFWNLMFLTAYFWAIIFLVAS